MQFNINLQILHTTRHF